MTSMIVLADDVAFGPPRKTGCHVYDCVACTGIQCPHRSDHPWEEALRHHRVTGEPLPAWMLRRKAK